jgi:hypothetical protein
MNILYLSIIKQAKLLLYTRATEVYYRAFNRIPLRVEPNPTFQNVYYQRTTRLQLYRQRTVHLGH